MKPETKAFFKKYDAWIKDCGDELEDKGFSPSEISSFDICEDGSVYMGNLTMTSKGYVMPWDQSKHFSA